jgi:hypothetical protein
MTCAFHPEREVAGYCGQCGRPLCVECFQAAEAAGACSACRAATQARAPATQQTPPPAPQPPAQPAAPRRSTALWWGLGIGCGCLILLLAILAAVGVISAPFLRETGNVRDGVFTSPPVLSDDVITGAEGQAAEPGEEAALAFAASRRLGWATKVTDHSDDWRSAYAVIGPSEGDWRTWLDLQWDDARGSYVLKDEGPVAQEGEPGEVVPDIYQPGEEVAKEAALTDTPDWVAKVVEHSEDWKSATVWIGPPQSEFVSALTLRWNDSLDCYELVGTEDVPYPE